MRILFVYDCVHPESLGGVEHRNARLAEALVRRGHEVTVAGWASESRTEPSGVRILRLPLAAPLYDSEGHRRPMVAARLAAAVTTIDLRNVDLVETANIPYAHVAPLALRCRLARVPLLVTWHEYWGRYWAEYVGHSGFAHQAVERLVLEFGAQVCAASEFTARRLREHGRAPVPVLPGGVPLVRMQLLAERPALDVAPFVYAGRLQESKRLELALRAVALLDSPQRPLLDIIGTGPDSDRLRGLTTDLGLQDRVRFVGRLEEIEDVWRHVAGAKVAVQPSRREGFGMFPLEAMALGLPVVHVTSDESAVADLVRDQVEGLEVAATPQALALGLQSLLDNEELRSRLAAGARLRSKDYDWDAVAARFEDIVEPQGNTAHSRRGVSAE